MPQSNSHLIDLLRSLLMDGDLTPLEVELLDVLARLNAAAKAKGEPVEWRQLGQLILPGKIPVVEDTDELELISLDQMANVVGRKKRTFEDYDDLPPPALKGHRGHVALWDWADVRPWLMRKFALKRLPKRFPGVPIQRRA